MVNLKVKKKVLDFVDGVVDVLKVDFVCIFIFLLLKMFEKIIVIEKMWFKFLFYDIENATLLREVEDKKKKLNVINRWCKSWKYILKRDDVIEENEENVIIEKSSEILMEEYDNREIVIGG